MGIDYDNYRVITFDSDGNKVTVRSDDHFFSLWHTEARSFPLALKWCRIFYYYIPVNETTEMYIVSCTRKTYRN